eukprot:s802_g7.t1
MGWRPKAGLLIEGNSLTSSSKAWRGSILETAIPPGPSEGSFTVTISNGLVRLGVCAADSDFDNLGTDLQGFGYGGTGKKSHGGVFEDYGEPFGAGDTLHCRVSRSVSGDLTVSYQKNGRELGKAFEIEADQLLALKNLVLYPALCGKAFTVHWMPSEAAEPVEWPCQLRYYAMYARRKLGQGVGGHQCKRSQEVVVSSDCNALRHFLGDRRADARGAEGESSVEQWVRGSAEGRADLRGSKEVRRVQRSHALPSGVTLTIIDSQPASKAGADRSYARNLALWEALPRGHAEVKQGETVVCELSGLRKFGSAEEKFGPLARGHGARLCALQTLPGAISADSELKLVFMTKENGEMCKVSFFHLNTSPYLALGSKNVTLAVTLHSKAEALADLEVYEEERYQFAKEMAMVFLDHFFELGMAQRCAMMDFVATQKATICGESISPEHQHIQSYRDGKGMIQAHIRFFSLTTPAPFFPHGLTLVDPMEAARLLSSWGLSSVEAIDEVVATDRAAVEHMEQKHLLLPNREGAVVYVVLRQKETTRTALVYKWKNAWYVTVRALREKFCKRVSEARIRQRIRLLHVHHPDEKQILEDFLSFYRFVLLLLPEKDFDHLGGFWVALKAAHDAFEAGACGWFETLPGSLVSQWHPQWVELFPKLQAALKVHLPESAQWIEVLRARRKLLEIPVEEVTDSWVQEAVECLTKDGQVEFPRAIAAPDTDDLTLTAVLVRGLQGSGKSTLCRALAQLTHGEWINQDEVAAGAKRGSNAKELFLKAISAAAAKPQVRYIFIDKIHILKQHRDDVVAAVMQGFSARGAGRVALVLLNLCHPEDEEGDYHEAAEWCTQRIESRGLGHLSLLPQAVDAHSVVCGAAEDAEVLTDEEKCSLDLCSDLDLRLPRLMLLSEALKKLREGGFLAEGVSNDIDSMEEAVKSSQAHELKLSSRWKTLYWMIALDWNFLWDTASAELRVLLLEALRAMPELAAVNEPHVTLAWLGSEEHPELDEELGKLEGSQVHFSVKSVCYDKSGPGLLALRVTLEALYAELCQNRHPHITVAKGPGVAAKESNDLLQRLAESLLPEPSGLVEKVLENTVKVTGVVQRQLASESLALAAATADALPEGHPVLPGLGLAATEAAVDVWATHESSIRIRKVERILGSLLCPVSQPLMHCKGWPPALRGKKWFTFHERPLQPSTRAALEMLRRNGSLATLHAAVAYLQLEDWQKLSLEALQQHLVERLRGPGVKALRCAAAVLEVTGGSFYVQCKSAGSQEETLVFRRALAAAVSELMDWIPEMKRPDLTLSAHVKDDWMLLGLVFPKAAEVEAKAKAKAKVVPSEPAPGQTAAAEIPLPEVREGLLQIDGATLEGGGQLLRNSAAYAATLQRGISICNVRGGRSTPGLRPAHLAALDALARLSGATLSGAAVGSGHVTFVAKGAATAALEVVDAGTGGSTMLMLQAMLPMMLARSGLEGGRPMEVMFKGGTNVCSPGRTFEINAPQVDYVQLVLFPVLRKFFGVTLELQVKQRGFLQGGGEVLVRCSAPTWPLRAAEMVEPGEILEVAGTLYRSAAVPQNVLPRMLEGQLKKRPGGAAVLLKEKLPQVVPHLECQECPTANGADACGLVLVLRSSTGCHFGGDSMGRKGTMAEAVGEEAARKACAAYERGGCGDEHLEDQLVIFMALAKGTSRLRLGKKQSLHFQTAVWLAQAFGASLRVVPDVQGEILEIQGVGS